LLSLQVSAFLFEFARLVNKKITGTDNFFLDIAFRCNYKPVFMITPMKNIFETTTRNWWWWHNLTREVRPPK